MPKIPSNYTLTGKFYHKKTLFGLILMVEIQYEAQKYLTVTENFAEYVKATERDLNDLKLVRA